MNIHYVLRVSGLALTESCSILLFVRQLFGFLPNPFDIRSLDTRSLRHSIGILIPFRPEDVDPDRRGLVWLRELLQCPSISTGEFGT